VDKETEKKYIEIMRKKSGEERLKIAMELRDLVLKLAKESIKSQNPKISSERLKAILQKRIYGFSFPFNKEIFIILPEDLILSKLSAYKETKSDRRLEDAKSILEIAKPDLNYIKNWAKKQSTIKILEEILKMNRT
jgi:hypothetical protein